MAAQSLSTGRIPTGAAGELHVIRTKFWTGHDTGGDPLRRGAARAVASLPGALPAVLEVVDVPGSRPATPTVRARSSAPWADGTTDATPACFIVGLARMPRRAVAHQLSPLIGCRSFGAARSTVVSGARYVPRCVRVYASAGCVRSAVRYRKTAVVDGRLLAFASTSDRYAADASTSAFRP